MFRTEIQVTPSPAKLQLSEKILTTGSCFSDAIGNELLQNKFQVLVNPFGTSYNPISIHKCLRYAIQHTMPVEHTYVQLGDIWSNLDFHSTFSALTKDDSKTRIKDSITQTHAFLKNARWLLITYGTSWVYQYNETHEVVANCHKLPSTLFTKTLLSQKKIIESFDLFYQELQAINPTVNIILTVSPVRHVKDTLQLNSVSKSILRLSCQTLTETYKQVHYFPSYEIMMDDLRDYRFYKPDMIHPSEEAERYIFQKFTSAFMDATTLAFLNEWHFVRQALSHKPFHPVSDSHQRFLKSLLGQLEKLQHVVDVKNEINSVKSQILN